MIRLENGLNKFIKLCLNENSSRFFAINYSQLPQNNESLYIDILKKCDKKLNFFVEFKIKIGGK